MVIDLARSALALIDIQNDFCPGGALAVAEGDRVVAPLNRLAARFAAAGGKVVATQDWHPAGHASFASSRPGAAPFTVLDAAGGGAGIEQTLWPDHCVQGSAGAGFHPDLDLKPVDLILRKGSRPTLDSYSAFFENDRRTPTGLEGWLSGLGLRTVVFGGLATDYCVLYSALDAVRLGCRAVLLLDACRGVASPTTARALDLMRQASVDIIESGDIE